MSDPKIFVFCNTRDCERGRGDWHSMVAIAEDGAFLAGHVCSHHGFAMHDMGINPDGWKRDKYAEHYPNGFDVEFVESKDIDTHPGLNAAFRVGDDADRRETA